jgi:STE24 endopeptidase
MPARRLVGRARSAAFPYHLGRMFLVVLAILGLVLTLSGPIYRLVSEPALVWGAAVGATLLPALVAALVAGRVLRQLDRHPEQPSLGQAAFSRGLVLLQGLLLACHGGLLVCTNWMPLCERTPVIGTWPLVSGVLAILPFLLSVMLSWLALYSADRAVRQIALEVYLFRGKPVRPVWSLAHYLLYNLRHQVLFVLIPMLLILGAHDVAMRYERPLERLTGMPYASDLLVGLAAFVVALITPAILRHVWVTQRLPAGPLRDRLTYLAAKLRLRCREILVWRTGGMIVNAAVMGVVAPLRYVLITDGMLEQMDDTKIEAVFGHEAGHVKRHHILFFLMFAFISGCAATIFSLQTFRLARRDYALFQWLATAFGLLLAVKWGVVFGWISRRFERQADVYGVRTLALSGMPCALPCALHAAPGNPGGAPLTGALCATAAHVFADALHEVALLNGIRPEARSWRHSSIASRSQFVEELALHPPRARRFERRVNLIKAGIFVLALVSGVWAAHDLQVWATLARWFGR